MSVFSKEDKIYFETLPCFSTGCADLQTLDTMQPVERKRQGYIHELIETEERYVNDLQLVVEVSEGRRGLCRLLRRWGLVARYHLWRGNSQAVMGALTPSKCFL